MKDLRKHLQYILSSGNFSLLEPLKSRRGWKSWPPEERELFAKALLELGQAKISDAQTADGEQESVKCFALAEQVCPSNGRILSAQGCIYFKRYAQTRQSADLMHAISRYRRALTLSPDEPQIALKLARALMLRPAYPLVDAAFAEVESLLSKLELMDTLSTPLRKSFYQVLGEHYLAQGEQSGEALELVRAIAQFRNAKDLLDDAPFEWSPYCRALEQLAVLTHRKELYQEILDCLQEQLRLVADDPAIWFQVGQTSLTLFELEGRQPDYFRAEKAFATAFKLAPNCWQYQWRWGTLCVLAGKLHQRPELVRVGLQKLGKANKLNPAKVGIISQIAECQYLLGAEEENLKSLKQAKRCLQQCAEKEPFDPAHRVRLGMCQLALGRYFGDHDHLMKALDLLQDALGVFGSTPEIQVGLALCSEALADSAIDPQLLERALDHFDEGATFAIRRVDLLVDWASILLKCAEVRGGDRERVALAVEKLQLALHLCEQMEIAPDAQLLFHFGCSLDFVGDLTGEEAHYEKAIQLLSQVLRIDPNHYLARFNLAIVYSHHGEAFEDEASLGVAAKQLAALAHINPEDELIWQEWGVCLTHLARLSDLEEKSSEAHQHLKEAEVKLRQALRLGALTPLYHLAGLHALKRQKEAALYYLKRAIEEKAVPGLEEIYDDEWLDPLRDDARFIELVQSLEESIAREASGDPHSGAEDNS